eukprot:587415-Amphidinium_carterae.1
MAANSDPMDCLACDYLQHYGLDTTLLQQCKKGQVTTSPCCFNLTRRMERAGLNSKASVQRESLIETVLIFYTQLSVVTRFGDLLQL